MLWVIEGIKAPPADRPHCPIPVYLVFSPHVLSLQGVLVSDGNMASSETEFANASDDWVESLPFRVILNPKSPSGRTAVRRRRAEVLIPMRLTLSDWLEFLVFRSSSEQELARQICRPSEFLDRAIVRPDWFYASEEVPPRPFLRASSLNPLTLDVANASDGLAINAFSRDEPGGIDWMQRLTYRSGVWYGEGKRNQVADSKWIPAVARGAWYLHDVCVAIFPFLEVSPPSAKEATERAFRSLLTVLGAEVIDLRTKGGALWLIGGSDLRTELEIFERLGIRFTFAPNGGSATARRSAWWTRWVGR